MGEAVSNVPAGKVTAMRRDDFDDDSNDDIDSGDDDEF